jgi:hypothetical protein
MESSGSKVHGFICGMPRSGTTWISQCVGASEKVSVFGETQYWGKKYLNTEGKLYKKEDIKHIIKNMWSFIYKKGHKKSIKGILDDEEDEICKYPRTPKNLFNKICEKVSKKQKTEKVMEKTPHHINYIDRIAQTYENARFLITKRNPYDFALSYKHQKDRRKGKEKKQFSRMYHPIGVSLVYRGYCRSINKAISDYPERTLVVSIEEIKKSPDREIDKIYSFFEIEGERFVLPPHNSSFPEGDKPTLNSEDLFFINLFSGDSAKKMGYKLKERPNIDSEILKSFARAPKWAKNVLSNMKSRSESPYQYIYNWAKKIFR